MDWKDLTGHQKLCVVQLTPDATLGYINDLVAALPNPFGDKVPKPWKRNSVVFSWRIEASYVLKIHAMMYLHMN